jgi:hypothetical protein
MTEAQNEAEAKGTKSGGGGWLLVFCAFAALMVWGSHIEPQPNHYEGIEATTETKPGCKPRGYPGLPLGWVDRHGVEYAVAHSTIIPSDFVRFVYACM